jgi:phosphatidylglycerophosphate synthase
MAAFGGKVDTYRSKDAKTNSMTFSTLRDRCRRESDYIITLVFTNEVSLFITWLLLKTRVTPNHVTIASLACGIMCGFSYLSGWFFFGSFFLFMSHVLDCADGNLARAKEMFSPFGRWLDSIGDKTADVFIFLCVGLYFYKNNDSNIWIILALLDALLLLLYYYIVDIALSLGISDKKQKITSLMIKGVHVKWGILEPVIYGFVILAPLGLIKLQLVLLFILIISGFIYQFYKNYKLFKVPS